MRKQFFIVVVLMVSLYGCSSKGQNKSDVSGTIVAEYSAFEDGSLKSVELYGIDDEVYGYYNNTSETTYRLEPGEHTLHIAFFSKEKDPTNIFSKFYKSVFYEQTDIASINIEIERNGKYSIESNFENKMVEFIVVDLLSNKVIHKTEKIKTTYKRKPKNPTTLIGSGKSIFQNSILNKLF